MQRTPEPELMDLVEEAQAYAQADFSTVNDLFVNRLSEIVATTTASTPRVETHKPTATAQPLILDLGCGPGDIAIRIARRQPAWRIISVNASRAMLHLAATAIDAANVEHHIRLVLTDAKRTPFAENAFDILACSSLLHHMPDPVELWREIARILRPGGALLLRDLMRPSSDAAAHAIVQQYAANESALLREEFHRSLLAAFTLDEVRDQLRHAGLTGMTVTQVSDRHLDVFGVLQ